ncbi:hypothetical protein GQ44DRAFT_743666 [Phaeosphaeriaceae sp. PMI808]|nr:hypothetical protein GQ44DRAFT_743666 [Phaeosphaeriaceae sp. PMI808]
MVSLWPWRASEDAASFEKTLNALTGKITRAAAVNDRQIRLSRRARVMWTLYAGFAYILAALLLTLVTGWRNWGVIEGTVVAGGPVVVYGIRYALTTYFDYRIRNTDNYLKKLNKERDATIERLKEATKYNSTQKLLEKYGASPKKEQPPSPSNNKSKDPKKPTQPQGPRTGIAPHQQPTSNAPNPNPNSNSNSNHSITPANNNNNQPPPNAPHPPQPPPSPPTPSTPHPCPNTLPKNRLALICADCRLVNGQAPPGARGLADVGRWRCSGCFAWNGVDGDGEVRGLVEKLVEVEGEGEDGDEGREDGREDGDGGEREKCVLLM